MIGTRWPEVMTAFGTVGVVVLSLALVLTPMWWRRFRAPKLKVEMGRGEPFVRPVGPGLNFTEYRLRVGIRNLGATSALGVTAQLLHWWEHDPERLHGKEWVELDTDPLPMKWVSIRPGDARPGVRPEVNIPPDATELLDLLLVHRNGGIRLLVDDDRQALFDPDRAERIGRWKIEFALVGTNYAPSVHTVEATIEGKDFVTDFKLSERPQSSTHVGRINLLHDLGHAVRSEHAPERPVV